MKKKLLLLALLFTGVAFRLWFISLNPLPVKFDQEEYYHMAQSILKDGWHNSSYRLYGYPLFIAGIYRLVGIDNDWGWRLAQAALDSLTGILIYVIGKKLIKREAPAFLGCLLYLFNPFTSAFVGVMLTEILAIFLLTFIFYLLMLVWEKKSIFFLFVASLGLGYIPQVRPGFLFYTIVFLIVAIYLWSKRIKEQRNKMLRTIFLALFSVCLYLLPFSYNILLNSRNFGQVSPLTADNLFVREFYVSLFVEKDSPKLSYTQEVHWMYQEYSAVTTGEERAAMARKYFRKGLEYIRGDPQKFLVTRIKKLWYVWEKPYIFAYSYLDPRIESLGYWGNVLLLALAAVGFCTWFTQARVKQSDLKFKAFAALFLLLIIYTSLIHIFSVTDGRFSLPAYSLIFLFAGFSIYKILILYNGKLH